MLCIFTKGGFQKTKRNSLLSWETSLDKLLHFLNTSLIISFNEIDILLMTQFMIKM